MADLCVQSHAYSTHALDLSYSWEQEEKRIRTFSYSPGPLNNAMQATVRESLGDSEQKEVYRQMHQEGKLVEPKDTANKLLSLLLEDAFTSGSHVDYYD